MDFETILLFTAIALAAFAFIELNITLKKLYQTLRLRKPGLVIPIFKDGDFNMLKFYLALPEKSAPDVVSRELTFKVGEADPAVLTYPGDVLATDEFGGMDGDAVVGALVDIDDAGNRSEAREFSFTLVDTIAPAQPGDVGLVVTGEVFETPVEPEVPAEPEAPSDPTVEE
jgi:hypothetical protein